MVLFFFFIALPVLLCDEPFTLLRSIEQVDLSFFGR